MNNCVVLDLKSQVCHEVLCEVENEGRNHMGVTCVTFSWELKKFPKVSSKNVTNLIDFSILVNLNEKTQFVY